MAANPPGTGPRSRATVAALPLAMLLAGALIASAAGTVVHQSTAIDGIYAERLAVPSHFVVASTVQEKALNLTTQAAKGTRDHPVNMSETVSLPLAGAAATAMANTKITPNDWTLAFVFVEATANEASLGNYSVQLTVNGQDMGTVYLFKKHLVDGLTSPLDGKPLPVVGAPTDDPALPVGARVTFDLGAARPASPFVVLTMTYLDLPSYTLKSQLDAGTGHYYWTGVGGSINGQKNPTLDATVALGTRYVAINGDGTAPHNLAVATDINGKNIIAGPSADVTNLGDTASLVWTPSAAGDYYYVCTYHVPYQAGVIHVTA